MQPGASFPLESNIDFLNGVSYKKGLIIGISSQARIKPDCRRLLPRPGAHCSYTLSRPRAQTHCACTVAPAQCWFPTNWNTQAGIRTGQVRNPDRSSAVGKPRPSLLPTNLDLLTATHIDVALPQVHTVAGATASEADAGTGKLGIVRTGPTGKALSAGRVLSVAAAARVAMTQLRLEAVPDLWRPLREGESHGPAYTLAQQPLVVDGTEWDVLPFLPDWWQWPAAP